MGVKGTKWSKYKTIEDRFLAHVEKTDTCWLWIGGKRGLEGYGSFWNGTKKVGAHRFAFERWNGPIPETMLVCHKCDVPACVRPDHLFLGTDADNKTDSVNKQRHAFGSKNRHAKLSDEAVAEIRKLAQSGEQTLDEIGALFGIDGTTASSVKSGRLWKHVSTPVVGFDYNKGRHTAGSKHHGAVLTEEDVVEIRRRVARGEKQRDLALEYGVTASSICTANSGKRWKHVK